MLIVFIFWPISFQSNLLIRHYNYASPHEEHTFYITVYTAFQKYIQIKFFVLDLWSVFITSVSNDKLQCNLENIWDKIYLGLYWYKTVWRKHFWRYKAIIKAICWKSVRFLEPLLHAQIYNLCYNPSTDKIYNWSTQILSDKRKSGKESPLPRRTINLIQREDSHDPFQTRKELFVGAGISDAPKTVYPE